MGIQQSEWGHKTVVIERVRRNWLLFMLLLCLGLTTLTLYVYTTTPGLHYLIIVYNTIGLAIMAIVAYLIVRNFKGSSETGWLIFSIAVLTLVPALFNMRPMAGVLISGAGFLALIGLIALTYANQLHKICLADLLSSSS